jgi:hypothetical protein
MMDRMKNAISTFQEDEIAFVYNTFRDEFSFFNKQEMKHVIQQWKIDFHEGKINIMDEHCKTVHFNDKHYFTIVIQPIEEIPFVDPTGYLLESCFIVNGFIYYFKNKTQRDTIMNWLH